MRSPAAMVAAGVFVWAALLAAPPTRAADPALAVQGQVDAIDRLLGEWQFDEAARRAERLVSAHPDLPAVQIAGGWVKFHQGDHQAALALFERAAAAFGGRLEQDPRLHLVRATARITAGFVREESDDGRVVVAHAPGVDRILVPDLIATVRRTLDVVGADLGHRPGHPIVVQVLPDAAALAAATGLTEKEIDTSGTIAVCKFGRLMVTSPRTTLKGYSYLDTASHELIHLIISQKTHNRTPIWLHEALAKYEDSRWRAGEDLYRPGLPPMSQSNLARALRHKELITFEQMHPSMALLPSREAAELAFSEVYTVTGFLLSRKGYPGIRALLEALRDGAVDMEAIASIYGLSRKAFVEAWLQWLQGQELVELAGQSDLDRAEDRKKRTGPERALGRLSRTDLRDHFHLGQLLRARGRLAAAVVEYEKARDLAGRMHAALWIIADKLGQVLAAVGRMAEAREAFETSLHIHPEDLEAHLHLGQLLAAEHPYLAYLHLREASRLNPMDPRVRRAMVAVAKRLVEGGDRREDFASQAERHRRALRVLLEAQRLAPAEPRLTEAAGIGDPGARGALRIVSRPWARLWLDFEDTGLTTPIYDLSVPVGRHVVGLVAACLDEPLVLVVRVSAGETAVIDQILCPELGGPDLAGNKVAE